MPMIIFVAVYYALYPDLPLSDYITGLWYIDAFLKILALCVLSNLFLFLLYIRRKKEKSARGVLAATFLFAFLILVLKLM